ncbi:Purple acid phosphatase 23 [Platanthera zijinensis]|uniref:Purple acid phosphatase 23 n=1 Tax=Platanthera zijinensis TaxID=2320716 RepID=A0AAP0G9E1_9ASPA
MLPPQDPSLRHGSCDIPTNDLRLAKKVRSNFPEQIALAASFSPTSMWISWVTGDAQIGANVKLLDPSSVGSEIWYGEESEKYLFVRNGPAFVYSQMYPFEGLLNYTSGIMHHVRIDGIMMENVDFSIESVVCNPSTEWYPSQP